MCVFCWLLVYWGLKSKLLNFEFGWMCGYFVCWAHKKSRRIKRRPKSFYICKRVLPYSTLIFSAMAWNCSLVS